MLCLDDALHKIAQVDYKCPRDTVITSNDWEFSIHKRVLARVSPQLWSTFAYAPKNETHFLLDIKSAHTMEDIITYAYTGSITITRKNVLDLLNAADVLIIPFVRESCCSFLQFVMDADNCLGIKQFAKKNFEKLFQYAKSFSELHFCNVTKSEEFLTASLGEVVDLITSDRLDVSSELDVLNAVSRWVDFDRDRLSYVTVLIKHVRLPLLPLDILKTQVEVVLLFDGPTWHHMTQAAREYHHLFAIDRRQLITPIYRPRSSPRVSPIILVFGGDAEEMECNMSTCTVERYDFDRNCWELAARMPMRSASAVLVYRGEIWCVGGQYTKCPGHIRDSVDIFDPTASSWRSGTRMIERRQDLGAAVVDGVVYAAGGCNESSVLCSTEYYNENLEKWQCCIPMLTKRRSFGMAAVGYHLFVFGGEDESSKILSSAECYSVKADSWTAIASMNIAKRSFGVGVVDGLIYILGICCEVYNPAIDEWRNISSPQDDRLKPAVTVVGRRLYVLGGSKAKKHNEAYKSVRCYDPEIDIWSTLPTPMMIRRINAGAVVINKLLHE